MKKAIIAAAAGIVAVAIIIGVAFSQGSPSPPAVNDGIGINDGVSAGTVDGDPFTAISDSSLPAVTDPAIKVEKVVQGLRSPTSLAFVGDDVLITEKDGNVRLVQQGSLVEAPVLSLETDSFNERGLLGVAHDDGKVFFYVTESTGSDTRHRVYRYDLQDGSLVNKQMILDLPGTPGPNHDGGKIIAHDGHLYVVIGDLNRDGQLQNFADGPEPDDTSVILKVDYNGQPAANVLAGHPEYYAYGVRNSFGLDFDPVSGTLWDTENGPDRYDEINIVEPGFNSGWERVMGPISQSGASEGDLFMLEGAHYSDPVFSWEGSRGVTDIEFLDSDRLGDYANNVFAGDINGGNLYYFVVNEGRDGLVLDGGLSDLVGGNDELSEVTLGTGFGGITDIETGPGGYLYVLSFGGNLYRLVPAE